jgi:hypothetical protein
VSLFGQLVRMKPMALLEKVNSCGQSALYMWGTSHSFFLFNSHSDLLVELGAGSLYLLFLYSFYNTDCSTPSNYKLYFVEFSQ